MGAIEFGKPLDEYIAQCQKCHGTNLVLRPLRMSEFVLENWPERMGKVIVQLEFYCHNCGEPVRIKNLKFTRI